MTSMFKSLALITFLAATACASSHPFEAKQSPSNAKSAYMSELLRGAVATKNSQLRHLDEEYEVDISGYSIKFQKCQFVKQYDDELAEAEDSETVLGVKRFVTFRLCPSGTCGSSCQYGYGEYVIDMEQYLEATIGYAQEKQEEMCQLCEETCGEYYPANNGNNGNQERRLNFNNIRELASDCSTCGSTCYKIEQMEENGYIDATNLVNCFQIKDEGDDGVALFAGAMCAGDGEKIKIGVFSDEECMFLEEDLDAENYLVDDEGNQSQISHALLKTIYQSDSCISCLVEEEQDENGNNEEDKEPEVTEVCQQLYEESAKCEKKYGFDNGYSNYAAYANQLANEEVVCDYLEAIEMGTYDQTGEIQFSGADVVQILSSTTGAQKFFLSFFVIGTVGLAVYAAILFAGLKKAVPKADLSAQGGTAA